MLADITHFDTDVTSSMVPWYSTGVPHAGSGKKETKSDEMVIDFYGAMVGLVIHDNGTMVLEERRGTFPNRGVAAVLKGTYLVLFCGPLLSKLLSK